MVDLSYQASVESDPLPGRPNPRFPDEVSPQAYGSQIGHGIEDAGAVLQNVHDKVQAQAQQTQLTDFHNQAQGVFHDLTQNQETGALTKQGKNAFGLDQQYLPQWDARMQPLIDGIADPKAKLAAQQSAAHMRQQLSDQLDTHELQQHKEFSVKTAQASVSIAQQAAAANYNHPGIVSDNLDTVDVSLQNLAKQQGWSDQQLQEATHSAHVGLYQGVLSNMLTDKKIPMAKAFLSSIPDGEITTGERKVAALAIQKGEADQTASGIVDTYRSMGPTMGAKALQQVDQIQDPDLRSATYANVERGLSQWHAEAQQTHGDAIMALESHLSSGQTTSADIPQVYALHKQGAFSAEQAGNMIGRIQKAQLDKIPDDTFKNYVADAASRGQSLDPMDKDLRKGMDAAFQEATQGQPSGSQAWINRGTDMAQRTGIVPDSLVAWSRSQIVSGDPVKVVAAASAISRVVDAVHGMPYALKDDKETVTAAKLINDAVSAGTDPLTAVTNQRTIAGMSDAQKLALDQQYKDQKVAASSLGSLRSLWKADAPYTTSKFAGMGTSIPDIPPTMLGQYEQLRQDYYKTTGGNVKQASELAQADLKNTWGISEVNGKREFMMYAPEAQHVGLTTDVVRTAMQQFVADQAGVTKALVDPDKIHLTPTVDTATTGGKVWAVSVPDQFGAYGPVLDKRNNPVAFTLPTATQALKSQATAEIMDKMRSTQNQQKLDDEGNNWLHQGLLLDQMAEDKYKQTNAAGTMVAAGRQAGGY